MSQETLQNPWIHRVGNPQFIRGIVKGYPWNRQRVSTEASEGIHGIVKGYHHQRVSAEASKGIRRIA